MPDPASSQPRWRANNRYIKDRAEQDWSCPSVALEPRPENTMKNTAKLLHAIGLVLVLGSILTFVVMNMVVGSSTDAMLIYHQRLFVSAISRMLTIPGVWILVGAGSLRTVLGKYRLSDNRWLVAKLVLCTMILINTMFVVYPLVNHVTAIAKLSAVQGQLLDAYAPLKRLEDRYGMANFLMLVTAFLVAVYKPRFERGQHGRATEGE